MKYCQQCGEEIRDEDNICPKCGYKPAKTNKTPAYKKWWFWVIIAIVVVGLVGSVVRVILVKTGVEDGGVNVELENSTYEPSFYLQNVEYKMSYKLHDFESSYNKTRVNEDGYVYYDVTIKFKLDCQLKLNGNKYNDDTIVFNPCVVFYSTNNSEFSKVIKTMSVNSGHSYDYSFTIENVCGGKEKEMPCYNYFLKLSVPANE